MPIMRLKEIAEMSPEAQEQRLIDLRVELARIRTMVNAGGAVENPARIRELRKTIAQILTVQNEQKLGLRKVPASSKKEEKAKKVTKIDSKEKTSE
ncbi:MAG: 50S ribosomal protein L29 [Nitrososphaerota archaeon]|jgi:large subunit ribosomal protein L29|nr:50S ribosomal protein L29 [Nitrososphaerota archaeon]